jgi:signal transduction histidine kinase
MKNISTHINEIVACTGTIQSPCIALFDATGRIQFINSHLAKVLHLDKQNITDVNFFSFLLIPDLQVLRNTMATIDNGNRTALDFPLKNGSMHWMKWEVASLPSIDKFLCVGYEQRISQPQKTQQPGLSITTTAQQHAIHTYEDSRMSESYPGNSLPGKSNNMAAAIIEAQEKERTNLGQELHDNVNQVLASAKLYLEMLHLENDRDNKIIGKAKEFIVEAINEIRSVSKAMVLPQLKGASLVSAVQQLVEDIQATGRYEIDFSYKGNTMLDIPEGKKITLFRIMQEQVKNIIKHSQASSIKVQLHFDASQVALMIRDNGIGFDINKKKCGIGLSNIFERADLFKGNVEIKTEPGNGCLLSVAIPL